jgi:hypothetical protein
MNINNDDGRWIVGTNGVHGYWISRRVSKNVTAREWVMNGKQVRIFNSEEVATKRAKGLNRI